MPAFAGRLTEAQVQALVGYVRDFAPAAARAAPLPADDFERRFRELEAMWDDLQRQLQELTRQTRMTRSTRKN